MENKFLLFIIGLVVVSFLCYAGGAGIGSTLLDDEQSIRILSPDVTADNGSVAINGNRNRVEYTSLPNETSNVTPVETRNKVANIALGIAGLGIGGIFLMAAAAKRRAEEGAYKS